MKEVGSHRDLIVWQKAMDLVVMIYDLTKLLPRDELYRLTSQATRSAASIPANIAEGNARGTSKDYANFLAIAKGSLMETETFVTLMVRLGYVTAQQAQPALDLITEVSKMLTVLRFRILERAGSSGQGIERREQGTGNREQGTGNRSSEQWTGNRK